MFQTNIVERIKTHNFMHNNFLQPDRPHMAIRRMLFACWIPKAINTLSEYEIPIAFPWQQRLHERVSMLRYSIISPLIFLCFADRAFQYI